MATSPYAIDAHFVRENRTEGTDTVATQLVANTIQASVRVKADTRRLFQALVSPEYVETWLTIPNSIGPWVVATVDSDGYAAWQCSPMNGAPLRIQAGFLVARRRRLSVCWKIQRNSRQLESRIAMRLIGDFDHTMLSICHMGFSSSDDLHWHHQLWHASLGRLANLYRNGARNN